MQTTPLFGAERPAPTKDDYYTPQWVFDGMGLTFDLDVAAPPGGVPWIPARQFYTQADDGLAQPWDGLVWCNPRFSNAKQWATRFAKHADGIMLVSLAANSSGQAALLAACDRLWVPANIAFSDPRAGRMNQIPWPVVMVAAGERAGVGLERLAAVAPGTLFHAIG